jgi:hypothetical protein
VTVNVANQPQTVNVAVSLDDLQQAREALRRNQQVVTIEHDPEPPQGISEGSGPEGAAPPVLQSIDLEDLA